MTKKTPTPTPTQFTDADILALRDLCLEIFKTRQADDQHSRDRVYLNVTELIALAAVSLTNAAINQQNAGKIMDLYQASNHWRDSDTDTFTLHS